MVIGWECDTEWACWRRTQPRFCGRASIADIADWRACVAPNFRSGNSRVANRRNASIEGFMNLRSRSSSPVELHPEALTEPCLSLSTHTARAIH
jgi:hypothetical protein